VADGSFGGNGDVKLASDVRGGIYGDVRVDRGTLVFGPGVYRFRSLTADAGTAIELVLDAGDHLVLEVERSVDLGKGVEMRIAGTASARDVLVLVAESNVGLGDGGAFVGTFVADDGQVRLGNGASLEGAMVGRSAQIERGAMLQYDPASALYADRVIR
jgi:hypothetical protein